MVHHHNGAACGAPQVLQPNNTNDNRSIVGDQCCPTMSPHTPDQSANNVSHSLDPVPSSQDIAQQQTTLQNHESPAHFEERTRNPSHYCSIDPKFTPLKLHVPAVAVAAVASGARPSLVTQALESTHSPNTTTKEAIVGQSTDKSSSENHTNTSSSSTPLRHTAPENKPSLFPALGNPVTGTTASGATTPTSESSNWSPGSSLWGDYPVQLSPLPPERPASALSMLPYPVPGPTASASSSAAIVHNAHEPVSRSTGHLVSENIVRSGQEVHKNHHQELSASQHSHLSKQTELYPYHATFGSYSANATAPVSMTSSSFGKSSAVDTSYRLFNDTAAWVDHQPHVQARKPVTSIDGHSRCLWPPNSTFLTMSDDIKERTYGSSVGSSSSIPGSSPSSAANLVQFSTSYGYEASILGEGSGSRPLPTKRGQMQEGSVGFGDESPIHSRQSPHHHFQHQHQHQHPQNHLLDSLQPRRKSRRVMVEKPTLTSDKTRNSGIVKEYVQRRIIEAVEDGTGELDLSSLELDDLPTEIKDMNYAVVYSERGSFSLTKNRLKLFLSSNHFRTIPMGVFSLQNLSVLSLRNNYLETIPPEIGLLHNLVELSIGGNKLKYLPSQIVLLPNLQILTVHPNLFKKPSQESSSGDTQGNGIETLPADGPAVQALPTQVIHTPTSVGAVGTFSTPLLTIEDPGRVRPIYQTGPTSRLFQQPLGFGVGASNSTVEANSIATHSWTSPILDGDDTEMVLVPNSNLGLYSGSQYSTDRPQNVTLDNIPLEVTDIEMEEDNLLPSWSQSSEQSNMTSTSADIAAEAFRSFLQREEDVDQVSYGQESQGSPAIDQIDVLSVGTQLRLAPGLIMETKHSRFPSLLTLAGNVILRCAQEPNKSVSDTEAVTGENMEALDNRVDGCQSFLGRPTFASSYLSQEAQSRPREKSSTTELFKEDMIKSYLTPDLYEVYRRARLNNICAGCKRRFWKPCKVVLVWQDILGQSQVPFEWKGCGIGACPSLPEQMLLHSEQSTKRAGSSSADNSMLDGAEDGEEIFSMTI